MVRALSVRGAGFGDLTRNPQSSPTYRNCVRRSSECPRRQLGYLTNGERDIVLYTQHIQPKIFIPGHMTAVALESSSLRWKVGFEQELNVMNAAYRPEVRWMVDPVDYLRPQVYDPKDPRCRRRPATA